MPNPFEPLRRMDVNSGAFGKHQKWQHKMTATVSTAIGHAVKLSGIGNIAPAQADTADNAEVFGVVQDRSVSAAEHVTVVSQGYIKLEQGTVWPESATFGDILYLSENTAGVMTKTAPSTNGTINKPVVHCLSTTEGIVVNYRGNVVSSDLFAQAPLLHIVDQKSLTSPGGGFTQGVWQTRDLNTIRSNEISGASVSSNTITLPAGTYFVEATAPAYYVRNHKARLENTTDGSTIYEGTSEYSGVTGTEGITSVSVVSGKFTLAATKNIQLQHRCSTTKSVNGFGVNSNIGSEVYSEVRIWKVG